ncbi:MAG: SDR family oxidoreductase [Myxococcota bacterium]
MIETGLSGRVALVTGANNPHGIGAAIARALASEGARVVLHYWRDERLTTAPNEGGAEPGESFYHAQQLKCAETIAAELVDAGAEAMAYEADLAVSSAPAMLLDRAEQAFGPVEVLVNNACWWAADTLLPVQVELANTLVETWTDRPAILDAARFDRMIAVNTRAPALLMAEMARRHALRGASWGRIINLSTAGAYCFPSEVTYGASKLALEGLTRSAAIEFGKLGITVNTISPGPIQTGWISEALKQSVLDSIPLGRLGRPDDVADVALFLASHQARWVTGQTLFVGGGHGM